MKAFNMFRKSPKWLYQDTWFLGKEIKKTLVINTFSAYGMEVQIFMFTNKRKVPVSPWNGHSRNIVNKSKGIYMH
jgi:hypothetical protein